MTAIKTPLPGTFYRRPSPEQDPYKEDGDAVAVGDVLGLVEVMKSFHEIRADSGGKGLRFVVTDGAPVRAGEVIAEIEEET